MTDELIKTERDRERLRERNSKREKNRERQILKVIEGR